MRKAAHLLTAGLLILSHPSNAADIGDTAELEAFVDGVVEVGLRQHNIAGAVVAITRDDEVIFTKGYGFSDVMTEAPVDPERTLFRIGSVTKLFTWTALMQLYEQGRIDLDTDINEYLETVEIPDTFAEPVTIADLMTHTGGFEDRIIGLFALEPAAMRPYARLLGEDLPARVRPPGRISSYSNHGVGIAGLIVEDVSGLSWPEYVQQNILDPLGMAHTAVDQPLPDDLKAHMSKGYRFEAGRYQEKGFEYVPLGAVGGISASAVDMTRFAMAHLNQGAFPGGRILQQGTAEKMHSPLFKPFPELNGWLHGFVEYTSHDRFMLGHNGGTFFFFSEFVLIPEENVSIFVSTNTAGGGQLNRSLYMALLERYFPVDAEQPVPASEGSDLSELSGSYATFRHPFTTPGKLLRLIGTITIAVAPDDQLVATGLGPQPTYWQEINPGLFQNTDSDRKMRFVSDADGARLFVESAGGSFYKLTGVHSPMFQLVVLGSGLILLGWALFAWPIQRLRRKTRLPASLHRVRLLAWFTSLTIVAAIAGIGLNASEDLVYGLTNAVSFFLWLPLLTLVLLVAQIYLLVPVIRDSTLSFSVKAYQLILVLSAASIYALQHYWNLIGTG